MRTRRIVPQPFPLPFKPPSTPAVAVRIKQLAASPEVNAPLREMGFCEEAENQGSSAAKAA